MMEFALALDIGDMPLHVMAADCDPLAPALHVPGIVPAITPPALENPGKYKRHILSLVDQAEVDLIVPLSDLDQQILAEAAEEIGARGCKVSVSKPGIVSACVDKEISYAFCKNAGLPMPGSKFHLDDCADIGPSMVKPILGSGSADTRRIESWEDLGQFVDGVHMVQEWVEGTEYGLDIFNDFKGRFASACVKRKLLMRAGETDRSVVVRHPDIEALARKISGAFRHVGNLDVDVIEAHDKSLFCLDFNPRFGGGYPATHAAGMNYLQALVDDCLGRPIKLPASPKDVTVMKGISIFTAENAG